MRKYGIVLMMMLVPAAAQPPPSIQYRHLHTLGSKNGIHPPKILNRKPATAALGEDEHPYGLGFPVGVATDLRNRVWIADSGTNSVHVFDGPSGGYREFRRLGDVLLQQPAGITADCAGRVYLTDSGVGGVFVDEMRRVDALHFDAQGRVYVVDSRHGKVLVFGETAGPMVGTP